MPSIETRGLTKKFEEKTVAVLGPNSARKLVKRVEE